MHTSKVEIYIISFVCLFLFRIDENQQAIAREKGALESIVKGVQIPDKAMRLTLTKLLINLAGNGMCICGCVVCVCLHVNVLNIEFGAYALISCEHAQTCHGSNLTRTRVWVPKGYTSELLHVSVGGFVLYFLKNISNFWMSFRWGAQGYCTAK